MAEIAAFAEGFAMIGHDHEVCVGRGFGEQSTENLVHIFNAADLLGVQKLQFVRVEKAVVLAIGYTGARILTSGQRLGDAMHARDMRHIAALEHVRVVHSPILRK